MIDTFIFFSLPLPPPSLCPPHPVVLKKGYLILCDAVFHFECVLIFRKYSQ